MSFRFKQFQLEDNRCAQKVGTDGVLIGAWTDVTGARSILDIGAGCGLVSLMLAQRTANRECTITAVEIDENAGLDCKDNFASSPWSERLFLINKDFKEINGEYDLIVSNPPFFFGDLDAAGQSRALARQGRTLNYLTLIEFAASHLTREGTLSFTSDIRHENEIIFTAELNHLNLSRICRVAGKVGKAPIRLLWEFKKQRVPVPVEENLFHRDVNNEYHNDYIRLTKEFYLDK